VQFEYETPLHKVEGQLNILILLSWHGRFYSSMLIISCFYMYNYNTVSGKASLHDEAIVTEKPLWGAVNKVLYCIAMAKLAIATTGGPGSICPRPPVPSL
jgi:hypothetical protein